MTNQIHTEKTPKFVCELCYFKCSKENEFKRHVDTNKHKKLAETNKKTPNDEPKTFNCICGNKYNHMSSLAKHKRTCIAINTPKPAAAAATTITTPTELNIDNVICKDDKVIITKDMFITLVKNSEEMMKIIKEQQLAPPSQITNNHNHNNTTNNTTNNHNNTFNLNFFLNEKCKHALNMSEFVDSLKITLDDLLFSKTNGISRGVTDVMIKGLKQLDIYKRPIHCTDVKRDTMYIKDEDKWQKDNNHDKMRNTIIKIADKERTALQQWAIENPDWMETEQKQIKYLTMVRSICEPIENYENYERKIVKNVGKEILVDK